MAGELDNQEIVLGAGEVYMYEFSGTAVPEDATIETDAHNVGHCSGGFSIEYKPENYDVENQYGKIVRRYIIKEAVTAKTGVLRWRLSNLALLSTAVFSEDKTTKLRKLVFGGGGNLKTVLLRFVHTKENGKKIRFTAIGQGGNGFAIEFGSSKELTVDAEIAAIEHIKNWLCELTEELTDEEAALITEAGA